MLPQTGIFYTGCVTKFQVPVRLHEKILELQDPVVGLAYIEELIPENDPEVHISYYYLHIPFKCGIICKTNMNFAQAEIYIHI